MTPTLKSILHEAATSLLESRDRVEARDVVLKARMLHADVFEREQERLLMEAAGRIAKAIMKELSENDQPTLSLFGLAVPTAIAVPIEKGGFYYVRTDKATWASWWPASRFVRPTSSGQPPSWTRTGSPWATSGRSWRQTRT